MALPSATISFPSHSIATSQEHLRSSKRVLALLGAGLSASSGISTFRGVGSEGLWHGHDPAKLATTAAFDKNPQLVWSLYNHRRDQALAAEPNAAHLALAELAKRRGKNGFMALSMNIDGLCSRTGHTAEQLLEVHGSLFDLKCSAADCDYLDKGNLTRNIIRSQGSPECITPQANQLPYCPKCNQARVLRPNIVWFGESLPKDTVHAADTWIAESEHIDLVLVIGTTAQVWPASGYVDAAIEKGARVAMVNADRGRLDTRWRRVGADGQRLVLCGRCGQAGTRDAESRVGSAGDMKAPVAYPVSSVGGDLSS